MGCDIHAHVEIKVKGVWHHWTAPSIRRDYDLFARMAGVRRDERSPEPIAEPKGMPDDASVLTKIDADIRWGNDGHSHSWLSYGEIKILEVWWGAEREKDGVNFFDTSIMGNYIFGRTLGELEEEPSFRDVRAAFEDIRIVFWFDN